MENNNYKRDAITKEEKQLIAKFRERVQDELPVPVLSFSEEDQELFLVRWLRARDLNLDSATKMLRASLQWRKEKNADQAVNMNIHPFFSENYPYIHAGNDKFGHPVFLIPLSSWDFRKLLNDADRLVEFDNFVTNLFETMCFEIRKNHLEKKETEPITKFTMLANVKNYSYMQLINFGAFKRFLQLASTYEAHYPEVLHRCVFINCPSYFGLFITMLKPVIAAKTLAKLSCYPKLTEWQKDIKELVDPAIVPIEYGGTKNEE